MAIYLLYKSMQFLRSFQYLLSVEWYQKRLPMPKIDVNKNSVQHLALLWIVCQNEAKQHDSKVVTRTPVPPCGTLTFIANNCSPTSSERNIISCFDMSCRSCKHWFLKLTEASITFILKPLLELLYTNSFGLFFWTIILFSFYTADIHLS